MTFLAWRTYPALMLSAPLLVLAEMIFPLEPVRLLALGVVMAGTFMIGVASDVGRDHASPEANGAPVSRGRSGTMIAVALLALLVLRWIPIANVQFGRELLLLAMAAATVAVLGHTPFAVTVAVLVAFVTPAVPLRTLALPFAVLGVAALARLFGMPRLRWTWASALVLGFVMLFFPWSGIVARAFPYFLRSVPPPSGRTYIANALSAQRSVVYDVPSGARSVILSGANVARLRRGALLGRIEPGAIAVRVGDVADWGYMRRDHFYEAHNPLPRDAAGRIRDYGYLAWVDGAGRVALPRGARTIRVTAAASLPRGASLQVEGFE